jgi:Gamma-glutamyl cyclotransferase, AIG2-like
MESRRIDVFFYGLFMDAEILRAKGLHPTDGRQACVSGMALRIGRRATLVPEPGKSVYGFVFRLTHEEIEQLYAEPSVAAYRPEAVIAQLADQSSIPALCFNLPPSNEAEQANPEYAEKLRAVASRLGLPADYAANIQ